MDIYVLLKFVCDELRNIHNSEGGIVIQTKTVTKTNIYNVVEDSGLLCVLVIII